MITRPRAWPAFRGFGVEILAVLRRLSEWEVKSIARGENKCAFMIARSARSVTTVFSKKKKECHN